ncbi:MAG TPA: efflux RND transporter periplasmic adaptor subunit [Caulobacteraceae bacterium]
MSEPIPQRGPYSPRPPVRRSKGRTAISIAVVVAVAVLLAILLGRCASKGAKGAPGGAGPGGRPAITVATAKASLGDLPIRLEALGTVTPEATVNVTARVAGMLLQVNFREGQRVTKGQLLAQIDPRPFQAALNQARGQLLRDQAALQDARLDLSRYRTLLAEDSIARQQVDTQAALVKQDEAVVVSDQANVTTGELNLSFTKIPAPVAGRVGLRQVDPGNQITANAATPITVVTEIDPIDVVFSLPEEAIPAVTSHGGGGTGGGLSVTAYDRSGGTALATGALSTIDNQIDTTTGTVKAKARFANGGGALFPNQFVNVSLLVDTLTGQVIVPTTAVRHGPQGDFVWVLQPDHTAKSRLVRVGPGTGETVSIVSGLKAAETVITEGGDRLRDGGKVILPGERPSFAGARRGGHRRRGGGGAGGVAPGG